MISENKMKHKIKVFYSSYPWIVVYLDDFVIFTKEDVSVADLFNILLFLKDATYDVEMVKVSTEEIFLMSNKSKNIGLPKKPVDSSANSVILST